MYSTSKAGLKQLSETLRVELEPLGVRVVTALIGSVNTRMLSNTNSDAFQLPLDSYYRPIHQFIEKQRGTQVVNLENVDVTAQNLVHDILDGAQGCIWRGSASKVCKWLSWLLPTWALEMATNRASGLSELRIFYAKNI